MEIPTPCYIFDLDRLSKNLQRASLLKAQTSCRILLALKGFSTECLFPYLFEYLDGISSSGAFEAQLGKQYGQFVSTFSPAYDEASFSSILTNSDIIVFNSIHQFHDFGSLAIQRKKSCGIRINPQYSELPNDFDANPCKRFSHLGVLSQDLPFSEFGKGKIEGIHLHTMCGQNADAMARTIQRVVDICSPVFDKLSWINLGGGQLYGADDYDLKLAIRCINELANTSSASIILEPCEGLLINCGYLVTTVIDIIKNEIDIVILDSSAVCHLSDAVYRGWKRDVIGGGEPGDYPYNIRLAGRSCFAGDYFGDYSFPKPLKRGDKIIFVDTATYSAVKSCMFNGLPLPSIAVYSKRKGIKVIKQYGYEVFYRTL